MPCLETYQHLGKARTVHLENEVWNIRFKNSNRIFGLSQSWLKVMRMEGNSQAATGQVVIILHRNYTARDFVIRAHSVLLLFFSVSHFCCTTKFSHCNFLQALPHSYIKNSIRAALMKENELSSTELQLASAAGQAAALGTAMPHPATWVRAVRWCRGGMGCRSHPTSRSHPVLQQLCVAQAAEQIHAIASFVPLAHVT